MLRSAPWTFRLDRGSEFWIFTGRGQDEVVEVHRGSTLKNQKIPYTWKRVEKVVPELVAAGFDYVGTDFVRVSQETIQKFERWKKWSAITPAPVANGRPAPWSEIRFVKQISNGVWLGVDANLRKVLKLTRDAAQRMVQNHDDVQVLGLGD